MVRANFRLAYSRSGARLTFLAITLAVLLTASACDSPKTEDRRLRAPTKKPVVVSIVTSVESQSLLDSVRRAFLAKNPVSKNGYPFDISIVTEDAVSASEDIASGKIKPTAWLSPSENLTTLTNESIRNLGAPQKECEELFYSPIVLAYPVADQERFGVTSTSEAITLESLKNDSRDQKVRFTFGMIDPTSSAIGLETFLYFARATNALSNSEATPQLKAVLSDAYLVNSREKDLLGSLFPLARHMTRGAFVTEQSVARYNLGMTNKDELLQAYYLKAPHPVVSYSLCRSDREWVTEDHKEALDALIAGLKSASMQEEIVNNGFRPHGDTVPASPPLTSEFKVAVDRIIQPAPAVEPTSIKEVLPLWEATRPAHYLALVVDTSSIISEESISIVAKELEPLIATLRGTDRIMLVPTSPEIDGPFPFSADYKEALEILPQFELTGPNLLFERFLEALNNLISTAPTDARKSVLILTDASDSGSVSTLDITSGAAGNIAANHSMVVHAIGIDNNKSLEEALGELVAPFGGSAVTVEEQRLLAAVRDAVTTLR